MKIKLIYLPIIFAALMVSSTVAFAQYIPTLEPSESVKTITPLSISLQKKYFSAGENIRANYNGEAKPLHVEVKTLKGDAVPFQAVLREDNGRVLDIEIPKNIKPGKYRVLIKDGDTSLVDEDIYWGKTVINQKDPVLKQGQVGETNVVFFGENGEILCDKDKELLIKNTITLEEKRENLIKPQDCAPDKKSLYQSVFQTDNVGLYSFLLKDEQAGQDITTPFDVVSNPTLEVKKDFVTFVTKDEEYVNKFTITANEDFTGVVTQNVPEKLNPSDINTTDVQNPSEIVENNSTMNLSLPFRGEYPITLGFGEEPDPQTHLLEAYRAYGVKAHDGVDFAVAPGTEIVTVDDGEVVQIPESAVAYGVTVVVQHGWGRSYYGHLSEQKVKVGDRVKKGDLVGLSGNTGLSTGPHLHFGIEPNELESQNGYLGKINPLTSLSIANKFKLSQKKLTWNVSLKKGESVTVGYKIRLADDDGYLISNDKLIAKNKEDQTIFEEKTAWTYVIAKKE